VRAAACVTSPPKPGVSKDAVQALGEDLPAPDTSATSCPHEHHSRRGLASRGQDLELAGWRDAASIAWHVSRHGPVTSAHPRTPRGGWSAAVPGGVRAVNRILRLTLENRTVPGNGIPGPGPVPGEPERPGQLGPGLVRRTAFSTLHAEDPPTAPLDS